jgi:hypothetical protein
MIALTRDQQSEDRQRPFLIGQPFEPSTEALARLEREDPKLSTKSLPIPGHAGRSNMLLSASQHGVSKHTPGASPILVACVA